MNTIAENYYKLGNKYFYGEKTESDYKKAFDNYKKAADLDHYNAMFKLCYIYEYGFGVDPDSVQVNYWENKALDTISKLAENGDTDAQLEYAKRCVSGIGYSKNEKKAFSIYLKLAENGNLSAMEKVAFRYLNGYHTEKNIDLSIYWYESAYKKGYIDAARSLASIYYERKDNYMFNYWFSIYKNNDTPDVLYILGRLYASGSFGLPYDLGKARFYFNKAFEKADKVGNYKLCRDILGDWIDAEKIEKYNDYKLAFSLLLKAFEYGSKYYAVDIADSYMMGKSVPEAVYYYTQAISTKRTEALVKLGKIYYEGRDVPEDLDEAEKHFKKVLAIKSCKEELHHTLLTGEEKSYKEALFYLNCINSKRQKQIKTVVGINFFKGCTSFDSVHARYKKLIGIYHPDKEDGCEEYTKMINNQYEEVKKKFGR